MALDESLRSIGESAGADRHAPNISASDDEEKLWALLSESSKQLSMMARREVSRHQNLDITAEDLLQDTFLRVWSTRDKFFFPLDRFQNNSHFMAVVRMTMRSVMIDHYRARTSQRRGGGAIESLDFEPGLTVDPYKFETLHDAISNLSEREQFIVKRHIFGGSTFEEVAIELGISARTAKRDYSLATQRLRKYFSVHPSNF